MSFEFTVEVGDWTVGQEMAKDSDSTGVAIAAMCSAVGLMSEADRSNFTEGLAYQVRKCLTVPEQLHTADLLEAVARQIRAGRA